MVIECDVGKLHEVGLTPTSFCFLYYEFKELSYPYKDTIPRSVITQLIKDEWLINEGIEIAVSPKFIEFIQEREDTLKVESWIKEYCDLFPANITNGGVPVKSAKSNCLKKMRIFLNQHKKITKADILEATTIYLERKSRDGYKFTTSSQNFISKDGDSLLLTFVEDGKAREEWRERIQNTNEGGSAFHKQL